MTDQDIARLVSPIPARWRDIAANRVRAADWTGWREIELRKSPNHRPPCPEDLWGRPPGCDSPCRLPPSRSSEPAASTQAPDPVDLLPEADRPAVRRWCRYARDVLGLDDVGPWQVLDGPPAAGDWAGLTGDRRLLFMLDAPAPADWEEP